MADQFMDLSGGAIGGPRSSINQPKPADQLYAEMRAEIERLRAALSALVAMHDYSHLNTGIGTALPAGKAWLEARRLTGNVEQT